MDQCGTGIVSGQLPSATTCAEPQVDPTSPFWFGLPTEVARDVHPWDDYILARSLVETDLPEDDLFAGVPGRSGSLSP